MKPKPLSPDLDKIELHPDGWDRFERTVKAAFQAPALHRPKKPKARRSVVRKKRQR
jgi:hypothetical protein